VYVLLIYNINQSSVRQYLFLAAAAVTVDNPMVTPTIPKMTYNVLSGTLNSTIPWFHHFACHSLQSQDSNLVDTVHYWTMQNLCYLAISVNFIKLIRDSISSLVIWSLLCIWLLVSFLDIIPCKTVERVIL